MKFGRSYLPAEGIFPFLGLNTLLPSTQLSSGLSPALTNMIPIKGIITKRRGYTQLGGSFPEPVLALIRFITDTDDEHLIVVTTNRIVRYDNVSGSWVVMTPTGWVATENDYIDYCIATGSTDVADGVPTPAAQKTWIIITNGVIPPVYWDGDIAQPFKDIRTSPNWNFPNFYTARTVRMFYNHLVFGGIEYTTGSSPFEIAWGDTYSLVIFNSGNAGQALLTDTKGTIRRFEQLGDRMIVYTDESIATMSYIGGNQIYLFEQLIQDVRLVSPKSILSVGTYQLYHARENIKLFDGTRSSPDVADSIQRSYRDELNMAFRHHSFTFVDTSKNRLYFGVPTSNDETVIYLAEFDNLIKRDFRWSRHVYHGRLTCMSYYSREQTLHWNDAELSTKTWDDMSPQWGDSSNERGFPVPVVGVWDKDTNTGYVVKLDELSGSDFASGTSHAIDAVYESPDFTTPDEFLSSNASWMEIELELRGTVIEVSYSLDQGVTWTILNAELLLNSAWTRYRLDVQAHGRTFRLRLRDNSTSASFELRWFRVWLRPGSPI
jgi:hypothetical protein